jgi:hypothetical protein
VVFEYWKGRVEIYRKRFDSILGIKGIGSNEIYLSPKYIESIGNQIKGLMLGLCNEFHNTIVYQKLEPKDLEEFRSRAVYGLIDSGDLPVDETVEKQRIEAEHESDKASYNSFLSGLLGSKSKPPINYSPSEQMPNWALVYGSVFDHKFLEFMHIFRFRSDTSNLLQSFSKLVPTDSLSNTKATLDQRVNILFEDLNIGSLDNMASLRDRISEYIEEKRLIGDLFQKSNLDPPSSISQQIKRNREDSIF